MKQHCVTRKLLYYNIGGFLLFFSLAESAIMSVNVHINSPNVQYTDTHITARYSYQTTSVHTEENNITVTFLSPSRCAYMQIRHLRTLTSLFGT